MRTLIAGIGALGGSIATRAISAGVLVCLATRTAESARALRSSGLRVSGIGGAAVARSRICRLSEGCDVCNRRAAASVRLPSSATATK